MPKTNKLSMPQPAFHLDLASQILKDWSESPSNCPFDIRSDQQQKSFLHGSLGPDMGFFPGARRELAELAHRGPTGDLIRCMLAFVTTDAECAFVYGWASHILLDAIVHPLVNRTAAERLATQPHSAADLHYTHIQLEIGLDLLTHRLAPELQRIRLGRVLTSRGFELLSDAHDRVHRHRIDAMDLFRAHARVARILPPLLGLQASMARAWIEHSEGYPPAGVRGLRAGLNTLRGLVNTVRGETSQASAFLTPLFFGPETLAELLGEVERFRAEFQVLADGGLMGFPNYNVDDGSIEPAQPRESAA